jgi:two-component system chemotaxis response regulator CheB
MALQRQGSKVIMKINDDPPENSCRPAADVLFRTAAHVYGSKLLAALLTGMGSDGLNGSMEIVNKSGCVIAQDEESSVVWGMPGAVVKANLVDGIYALNDIPAELFRRTTI